MAVTRIGIDELIDDICDHLAETDGKYRAKQARAIGASFTSADDVLTAIHMKLSDEDTPASVVIDLANELLTPTFEYDGDGEVTVRGLEQQVGFRP